MEIHMLTFLKVEPFINKQFSGNFFISISISMTIDETDEWATAEHDAREAINSY